MEIIKCKEYYIDCENYHTFDLKDICKFKFNIFVFTNIPDTNIFCPIKVSQILNIHNIFD